jgi:hypothetical protein
MNQANLVARQKARELLAAGAPVPLVAQTLGKNKNTIYKWMKSKTFAERLRVEIKRDMSGTRRALGQIARKAIASADESLNQLQRTRDNAGETTAARDRAANRLLNHAYKWGRVVDPELESGEACGSTTFLNEASPVDYVRENENLVHKLHQATEIMMRLEKDLMAAGVPVTENIPRLVEWMGFDEYSTYLEKDYLAKSAIFKRDPEEEDDEEEVEDPEVAERERRDAERERKDKARRAAFRRAEIDGTPPPYEKEEDDDDDGAEPEENEGVKEDSAVNLGRHPGATDARSSSVPSAESAPAVQSPATNVASAEPPRTPARKGTRKTTSAKSDTEASGKSSEPPTKAPLLDPISALNAAIAANPELKKQQEELLRKQSQVYPRISLY